MRALFDRVIARLFPAQLGTGRDLRALPRIRARLLRRLSFDQSWTGRHAGEFGRGSSSAYEKIFLGLGSKEDIEVKPRLYLTVWPVQILAKHDLLKSNRARCSRHPTAAD